MTKITKKQAGSAAMAGICALAFAGAAQALEAGDCFPKPKVNDVMFGEGQIPMLKAERRAVGGSKTNFFTTDVNFSQGYIIEENGSDYCVSYELSDIVINDLRNGKKPEHVATGRNLDRHIESGARNGYYTMFQAYARGTETQGYITISSTGNNGDGGMTSTGTNGSTGAASYRSVAYTKNAIEYFEHQKQVSLSKK